MLERHTKHRCSSNEVCRTTGDTQEGGGFPRAPHVASGQSGLPITHFISTSCTSHRAKAENKAPAMQAFGPSMSALVQQRSFRLLQP